MLTFVWAFLCILPWLVVTSNWTLDRYGGASAKVFDGGFCQIRPHYVKWALVFSAFRFVPFSAKTKYMGTFYIMRFVGPNQMRYVTFEPVCMTWLCEISVEDASCCRIFSITWILPESSHLKSWGGFVKLFFALCFCFLHNQVERNVNVEVSANWLCMKNF